MLCDIFAQPAEMFPDKPAVVRGTETITYRNLARAMGSLCWRMRQAGLRPGDTVALQMPNGPEYVAGLWAAWWTGICVVPLDPALKAPEVETYCKRAGASAVLRTDGPIGAPIAALIESIKAPPLPEPFPRNHPALLLLSSGTTGLPKLVVRSPARVQAAAGIFKTALPCEADDRVLGVLPFYHAAGLFNVLLSTIERGATLFVETFAPRQTAATIQNHRITFMSASPFMYRMLAQTRLPDGTDLSSLRIAYSGTSAMNLAILRGFEDRFGVTITQGYGTTETNAVAVTRNRERIDQPSRVGRPYPAVTVTIRNDAGEPVAGGGEGTVCIRSPGAATAYLGDEQGSSTTFRDGEVVTSDVGRLDATGNLCLMGRKRPLLGVAGRKVAPAEVEACLRGHPAVGDVSVYGEPGPDGYDRIKARVVCVAPVAAEELRAFCADRLADYKLPRQIEFVEALAAKGGTWKQPGPGQEDS